MRSSKLSVYLSLYHQIFTRSHDITDEVSWLFCDRQQGFDSRHLSGVPVLAKKNPKVVVASPYEGSGGVQPEPINSDGSAIYVR